MSDKNMNAKVKVNFTKASTRQNITSGENISTSFGKISKYLDDLGTAAFTDSSDYATPTDLSNKVDKVAGKELMPSDLLDANGDIALSHLPDIVLGQMIYGGTVNASNVATLSTNAKTKLGTASNTITLTNNTTAITGYVANEGIYYIATGNATLANLGIKTGDWLLSTGSAWSKIDNTDEVSSVNGKTGAITLNATDIGAVSTTANQGLSDTEKANARTNIGAATSAQGTKADSAVQTIKMNGSSVTKTDGVVNLGTVITAHQDISGKADKSATVSNVTYDTTNKKLTKTINGTTSDVVTTAQLKTDMALSKSDVGLGNVDNTSDANKPISIATQTVLDGKVSKTGDTMTGTLQLKSSNIDRDGDNPSTLTSGNEFQMTDKSNLSVGGMYPQQETSGAMRNILYSRSGSSYNTFAVITDKDGTSRYSVSSPSAFRSAIGLDNLGYYGIGGRTTNTTTNPWVLVAETTATTNNSSGITLLFDYTFIQANNLTSKGTGILSVGVRTDTNGAIIANASYAKWLTKMNELNNDDIVITYNNSTKSLQIWAKSDYAYKIFRVRPLSGSNVHSSFDISKWTFTASLNTNMHESYPTGDGITVLTPTCDMQEQIDYNTNNGVKNRLKINIPEKTARGLTFTPQSDGTIVINGTANVTSTGVVYFNLEDPSKTTTPTQHGLNKIGYGNFIISLNGDEEYMAGINLQFLCYDTITENPPVTAYVTIGESKSVTIGEDKTYVWFRLALNSSINGKTFDNFVLKPMIRDASIEDDTFQPYAKSNAELTQDLNDISEELDCLTIQAALVNDEVVIQNTSDFTAELFNKYSSYTRPRFAILKLQIAYNTYYYKALLNKLSLAQASLIQASFKAAFGEYTYNFTWGGASTLETPKITRETLNLGSNAGFHNSIYRGKNLGTSYTAAQKAQVQAGTFDDLFVGDYWTINGINWRIAHCDYYLNAGDTATTAHHLVIVPDEALTTSYMNTTGVTTGAYANSYMYTTTLLQNGTEASDSVFGKIKAAFGESNLLSIRQVFSNAIDDSGNVSGSTWYTTRCFLMNQTMLYGHKVWSNGNNDGDNVGIDKTQLALFAHDTSAIDTREAYWLRDVCSSSKFAFVAANGIASTVQAFLVNGVRPVFLLS